LDTGCRQRVPRISHSIFDSKGRTLLRDLRTSLAKTLGAPAEAADNGVGNATTPAALPVTSPTTLHASSHAGSYAGPHAGTHVGSHASPPPRFPPLTTTRIGDKSRVVNGHAEWSQEDFARAFLRWFADTYPDAWQSWVWFPDVRKHYFPRFKVATGARYLQIGALVRGLGVVTQTRPHQYVDDTGKRRSTTEYWMGPR
jgi:hypothetical protein